MSYVYRNSDHSFRRPSTKGPGEREVVLVPLDKYNALLDRLEDLEDMVDMLEALKEPRRPLAEYLAQAGTKADV